MTKEMYSFIIRPFRDDFDKFYNLLEKKFIDNGFPKFKDAKEYSSPVTVNKKVKNLIEEAEYIICDITLNNSNVLWELGYAEAKNKPCVLLLNISENYNGELKAIDKADIEGIDHIRYSCDQEGNNLTFIEEEKLKNLKNNVLENVLRQSESMLINKEELRYFITINKSDIDLLYLCLDDESPNVFDLLSIIEIKKLILHVNKPKALSRLLNIRESKAMLVSSTNVKITPLKMFADFLLISGDTLIFSINSDNHFWMLRKWNDPKNLTRVIDELNKYSLFVSTNFALRNVSKSLKYMSLNDLFDLKDNGLGFFDVSQYWFRTPEQILLDWQQDDIHNSLSKIQDDINKHFYSFANEVLASGNIKFVYSIWPLLNEESISLEDNPQVNQWLGQLNNWAAKENNFVYRFLIVKGNFSSSYSNNDFDYLNKIYAIIKKHFANCNYSHNIYIIIDDQKVIDEIFSGITEEEESFLRENSVLFLDSKISNSNCFGYLQQEDKLFKYDPKHQHNELMERKKLRQ